VKDGFLRTIIAMRNEACAVKAFRSYEECEEAIKTGDFGRLPPNTVPTRLRVSELGPLTDWDTYALPTQ
jgi:hypothetical protein